MAKTDGIVSIHGKEYATVAYRLALFRADYPKGSIITELISDSDGVIVFKASIFDGEGNVSSGYGMCKEKTPEECKASNDFIRRLYDEYAELYPLATGYAEEVRGSSNINKTRALENAETSAVGRALAFAGYHSSTSIASADEVSVAIARQNDPKAGKKQVEALEAFFGDQEDGADLLQKLLNRAGVDHLKEITKPQATACIKKWGLNG